MKTFVVFSAAVCRMQSDEVNLWLCEINNCKETMVRQRKLCCKDDRAASSLRLRDSNGSDRSDPLTNIQNNYRTNVQQNQTNSLTVSLSYAGRIEASVINGDCFITSLKFLGVSLRFI